jgi:hypothetical protein
MEDRLLARSTGRVQVIDEDCSLTLLGYEPVEIRDADDALLFAGFVGDGPEASPLAADGSARLWTVRLVDNHYRADKTIIAGAWADTPVRDVVQAIVTGWLAAEGVTFDYAGHDPGPTVTRCAFNYVTAAQALERLATLAGWWWRIGHDCALELRPRTTYTAPWELNPDSCNWRSVRLTVGSGQYRNRQYVRGGRDETEEQVEQFAGNAEQTTYTVGYPMVYEPVVKEDRGAGWVTKTVGIRGLETGCDWYWNKGDKQLTQDTLGTPLDTDELLQVTYIGSFPVITQSTDIAAQLGRAALDGTSGLVASLAQSAELDSRQAAFDLGAALLAVHARVDRVLTFRTRLAGLQPGQLLTCNLPAVDLDGLPLLVQQVTVTAPSSEWVEYEVTAVEGQAAAGWAEWLQDAGSLTAFENIGESEVLGLLELVVEDWSWGELVAATVNACPIPSAGLYPSATLYPC